MGTRNPRQSVTHSGQRPRRPSASKFAVYRRRDSESFWSAIIYANSEAAAREKLLPSVRAEKSSGWVVVKPRDAGPPTAGDPIERYEGGRIQRRPARSDDE